MNWRFWKKKIPICFGYYNATVLPFKAYLVQKCSMCEDNIQGKCIVKSLKPILMLDNEINLEAWR